VRFHLKRVGDPAKYRHACGNIGALDTMSFVFTRRSLLVSLSSTVGRPPDLPLWSPPMQKNLQYFPKSRANSAFNLLRH
jgi:hypothetical protein